MNLTKILNMEIIGKPTNNPYIFYTGKFAGYIVWLSMVLYIFRPELFNRQSIPYIDLMAFSLFSLGLLLVLVSLFKLGKSTRFGLPTNKTILKTDGIYRYSRNPIYVGYHFMTVASVMFTMNIIIGILGIYCIIVYHLIIKNEEKFLNQRFGVDYEQYTRKVGRYL